MKNANFTWNEKANAYVSDIIDEKGDIYIRIELKEVGIAVIKQNNGDGNWSKSSISKYGKIFEYRLYHDVKDVQLKFFTSSEPKIIKYANI